MSDSQSSTSEAVTVTDEPTSETPAVEVVETDEDAFKAFLADVDDELDEVDDEDDLASDGEPAPDTESPPGAPPAEPKEKAASELPAAEPETPPVEQPKEAPVERPTEPVQPAPAVEAPQQQPLSQEELEKQFQAQQEAAVDALSTHYALTEEQVALMDEKPQEFVPKLAARIHMDVLNSVMQTVQRAWPAMHELQTQQQTQQRAYEDKFYEAWPQLNPEAHGREAQQYAVAFRHAAPDATPEQVIQAVGAQLMVAHAIDPQPATPPAPAVPQPFVPVTSQPAMKGAAPPPSQVNQMVEQFLVEDLDED